MDERDSMAAASGAGMSLFYIQNRGLAGPISGPQPGSILHLDQNPHVSLQSPDVAGSSSPTTGFQVDVMQQAGSRPLVAIMPQAGMMAPAGIVPPVGIVQPSGLMLLEPGKKKRGRPRKVRPDGPMLLGLSQSPSSPQSLNLYGTSAAGPSELGSGSAGPLLKKRGRGRPPGSGKFQQLASLGKWVLGSVGTGFTPHAIFVQPGEDVAAKIVAFSQQGPRAVCILSATGTLSEAALGQTDTSDEVVKYKGHFEILCLSGSYWLLDDGVRSGGLCVALCGSGHRIIGGNVVGALKAAGTVQVIVGSFVFPAGSKKRKAATEQEGEGGSELAGDGEADGDSQESSPRLLPNQNYSPPPLTGGWLSSVEQADVKPPKIDINRE